MTRKSKKLRFFYLSHSTSGRSWQVELGLKDLARLAGVSEKTARRWIDGTQEPHPHTLDLLRIKVFGLIPHPGFEHYQVYNGKIRTQSGEMIDPRDLDALTWLRGLYYRGLQEVQQDRAQVNEILALLPSADLIEKHAREKVKRNKTG